MNVTVSPDLRRLAVLCIMAAPLFACDDGSAPPQPARLEIEAGDAQSGVVGAALALEPRVRVLSSDGRPVRGVTVTFQIVAGGGAVARTTAVTDSRGSATAGAWTLGNRAGGNTLSATVARISPASFNATGTAGPPVEMTAVSATSQSAPVGTNAPAAPIVRVTDAFDNPVAGVLVVFNISAGGGTLSNSSVSTGTDGIASAGVWTLPVAAGTHSVTATAAVLAGKQALFTITAEPRAASRLGIIAGPSPSVVSGAAFSPQFVIEIQDELSNRVAAAASQVTASLLSGTGALGGTAAVMTVSGRATFDNLSYTGSGPFRLLFSAPGLQPVQTPEFTAGQPIDCSGGATLDLNFTLGQTMRFRPDVSAAPRCLHFDATRNANQSYLVMVENMPRLGGYTTALFPGQGAFNAVWLRVEAGTVTGNVISAASRTTMPEVLPPNMVHAWDFGSGRIYEYEPVEPPGGAPRPVLVRGHERISLQSASAAPVVGDTVIVFLEGIPRLNIQAGNQRAVVRMVSNELIIAEDVRLSTLTRPGGTFNTPLAQADMDSIARAYAAHSKIQADLLFSGRYNNATEAERPPRIIAVHTIMPADNVWGYTYSSTNAFAWDYWVLTNGSTKSLNQHAIKNAHNLFMHEIAHTRHWGLLERTGRQDLRGNRWLVEGFARFTERLPTASYLLNSADPSRTGNAVMRLYPEFGNSYYRDDVPTFLNQGSSVFDGYQASSYIFDYLADQVALAGRNWRNAIIEFLTFAGVETSLDATVAGLLPGLTFQELYTRARLALYLDDFSTAGLPAWTQYLQFNLRASRPAGSASAADPRTAWPRILPGSPFLETRAIFAGAAFGYLIDGAAPATSARISFRFEAPENAVLSVTRIR